MMTNIPLDHVFNDDIMEVLRQLPDNSIDCIFGDPDYNVGIKYNSRSYTTDFDLYIKWYCELARECMRVLKDSGNAFFINYPKQNAYLRVRSLDEISAQVNEYVWIYNTNVGHSKRKFTTAHRSVLHATKSEDNAFYKDNVAEPYQNPTDRRIRDRIARGIKGRMPYSWFYFDLVKNVSHEKTVHACQIPQKLSEMVISSCTMPGDNVLILFGGSGAEVDVCRRLERHFIAAELDPDYYQMIVDRISSGQIDSKYKLDCALPTSIRQQIEQPQLQLAV